MFPPSLHKNIRELDRQISLLETECESMDVDTKEDSVRDKITLELANKPFVTDSIRSACSHSSKKFPEDSPITSNTHPVGYAPVKVLNKNGDESSKREVIIQEPSKSILSLIDANTPCKSETKKAHCKSSISSIKDASEHWSTSAKNYGLTRRYSVRKKSKHHELNEKVSQQVCDDKRKGQDGKHESPKSSEITVTTKSQDSSQKSHSTEQPDEATRRDVYWNEVNEELCNGEWPRDNECLVSCPSQTRRSRSIRTKKKFLSEILIDEDLEKSLDEKEIQCMLWHEDNSEYLLNLNQCIKALYYLIGVLRKKSSQDKFNDVLNNMQNTLVKIGGIKAENAVYNYSNSYNPLKGEKFEFTPEESNVELKKTLFQLKTFYHELSDEKSNLYEELEERKRFIINMKNKEKEYLTLISSLKFNLEKTKEQAEEGVAAITDLKLIKNKLQEETKVIEALKKSHGKMQEIVENYVLENDKLRTQIRIAKLESHKYNALLAGKEVEIKKYKEEMELFQRQISEQLKLLRSKASGNNIENAIEVITNQANIPSQIDDDTFPSDTTFAKSDFNEPFYISSGKSSLASLWTQTYSKQVNERELMVDIIQESKSKEMETEIDSIKLSGDYNTSIYQITETDVNTRDAAFKSCKSEESDEYDWKPLTNRTKTDIECKKLESKLEKICANSNEFTANIDDIFTKMETNCLGKVWTSSDKLCNSSKETLVTSSSDGASGCNHNA